MGDIKSNVGGKVSAMLLEPSERRVLLRVTGVQGTGAPGFLSTELPFLMTRGLSQVDGRLFQNRKQRTFLTSGVKLYLSSGMMSQRETQGPS